MSGDRFPPYPEAPCIVCCESCSLAYEYATMGGKEVCGACATIIANVYSMKHSGQYLTWPNAPLRARQGYQKRPIPESLRWEVFERDGFACLSCASQRYLRADHIVPESTGGPTTLANLQTLCRSCNSRKGVGAEVPQ